MSGVKKRSLIPALVAMLLVVGTLSCTGFFVQPLPAQNDDGEVLPFDHELTVARHAEQRLSEASVDNIFAAAGGVLFSIETECPDVYCPSTFTRSGEITTFTVGDNIVTNDAQLNAIFNVDADIKVVSFMVGVCGAPSGNDPAVVLGCAASGGSVTIAHDAPADVWAHEWGHVQGLPHRNSCPRNLMHAFELETNAVNETERNALLTPTPGSAFRRISDEPADSDYAEFAPYAGETPGECVQRCVGRKYLAGVPAAALAEIETTTRVNALLELLVAQPTDIARANIVRLLGLAGQARACAAIIDSLALAEGDLTTDEFSADIESILALGRLAAQDDTGAALNFLIAGAVGEPWSLAAPQLVDAEGATTPVANALSRVCVLALGISKRPEAKTHLQTLRIAAETGKISDPWMTAQLDEALARIDGSFARMRRSGTQALQY